MVAERDCMVLLRPQAEMTTHCASVRSLQRLHAGSLGECTVAKPTIDRTGGRATMHDVVCEGRKEGNLAGAAESGDKPLYVLSFRRVSRSAVGQGRQRRERVFHRSCSYRRERRGGPVRCAFPIASGRCVHYLIPEEEEEETSTSNDDHGSQDFFPLLSPLLHSMRGTLVRSVRERSNEVPLPRCH